MQILQKGIKHEILFFNKNQFKETPKFISKSQERITKLKKVSKNEIEGLELDYDSDEDYTGHKFEINEKYDYM